MHVSGKIRVKNALDEDEFSTGNVPSSGSSMLQHQTVQLTINSFEQSGDHAKQNDTLINIFKRQNTTIHCRVWYNHFQTMHLTMKSLTRLLHSLICTSNSGTHYRRIFKRGKGSWILSQYIFIPYYTVIFIWLTPRYEIFTVSFACQSWLLNGLVCTLSS